MRHCPTCQQILLIRPYFQYSISTCPSCHWAGFSQTALEKLVHPDFNQTLQKQFETARTLPNAPPCFACSAPTREITLKEGVLPEQLTNLRIFQEWKTWHSFHREGKLSVRRCTKCGTCAMNARTTCHLPIDWATLEADEFAADDLKNKMANDPEDPLTLIVPQMENLPSRKREVTFAYGVAAGVVLVTAACHTDSDLGYWLVFSPWKDKPDWTFFYRLVTYSWVHIEWAHCICNLFAFLMFAPSVEQELGGEVFCQLIAVSAASSAIFQNIFFPSRMVGLQGVVAAIISFFYFRFPRVFIRYRGMSFSSLGALLLFGYLNLHLLEALNSAMGTGFFAALTLMGGALTGFGYHLLTPKGPVTADILDEAKRGAFPSGLSR